MATVICLKGFVIFTSLCLLQQASAEPKYTPRIIPKCNVIEFPSGIKRCSYTLEDVKTLYMFDAELQKLQKETSLQGQKINLQSDIIVWQQGQLRLSQVNTKLFSERMKSLTNLYVSTDKKLQGELARPRWGSYISWGIAAAVVTLFTGYVVADQIAK